MADDYLRRDGGQRKPRHARRGIPLTCYGEGVGDTTYILQADTNRWASSLPNCPAGWENREDRHFRPLPSLSRMRRYDTAINFPESRELFHRSRRHFGEFPRVYIFLNKRRDGAKRLFFRDERKYSKGFRFFYETLPFFFRKKARRLAR